MKKVEQAFPFVIIILAVVLQGLTTYIVSYRTLTALEGTILQGFSLLLGLAGSYVFGKQSAQVAAREMIKPHARSAFRRLVSLYRSLSRVTLVIQSARDQQRQNNDATVEIISAIVSEQIAVAGDALEDWRDIVPEELDEIYGQLDRLIRTQQEG